MPVSRFTFDQARDNLHLNTASRWYINPARYSRAIPHRLSPFTSPVLKPAVLPKFKIRTSDRFFTIGSCFARELEQRLTAIGVEILGPSIQRYSQWQPRVPPEFEGLGGTVFIAGYANKYTGPSMLNELMWADEGRAPSDCPTIEQMSDGRWVDLNAHNILTGDSEDDVRARREILNEQSVCAFQADIIVITLGLTEAWYDRKKSLYVNDSMTALRPQEPERFEIHVLSFTENLACLEKIYDVLRRKGKPGWRMILTVSPVPLLATFGGQDVVTANCYSKSVLRAVAEEFSASRANVDYFPSYEMVTHSDVAQVWFPDRRHVKTSFVDQIVDHFMQIYLTSGTTPQ